MTERQRELSKALENLCSYRLTKEELNEKLTRLFGKAVEVEEGQYDEDWQGDDYFTFEVDDDELGGYFDLYYIQMPRRPELFFITEVCVCFE
jgi:hypothetical protein